MLGVSPLVALGTKKKAPDIVLKPTAFGGG
jgi:hypothetical protein